MADEGVAHCGQGELERCEVTRTSTSSGVWLTEVSSRPSGKGNNGDEGINFLEIRFLGWLEQIFEEIPENITVASPKSWKSQVYIGANNPKCNPSLFPLGQKRLKVRYPCQTPTSIFPRKNMFQQK